MNQQQQQRHRCRNPRCRAKLAAPVENPNHAFCCRGCYESFHRNRCRVCERDLRKQGRRGDAHRLYCRPPAKCKAEGRKWPHRYEYEGLPAFSPTKLRTAESTGTKFGIAGYRPTAHCLRHWWWGDPGVCDLSLYDPDGLTIARIVLEDDGLYHLRTQVTWPRLAWPDLGEAKRCAESMALAAIPLESVDPKLAARIAKDNATSHPMGPPLNRSRPVDSGNIDNAVLLGASSHIAAAKVPGDPGPVAEFLQRQAALAVAEDVPNLAPDQDESTVPGRFIRTRESD